LVVRLKLKIFYSSTPLAHRKLHPSPPVNYPLTKPVNECTSTVSAIKSKPGTNQDAIIEITVFENISIIILNKSGHKILDTDLNKQIDKHISFHYCFFRIYKYSYSWKMRKWRNKLVKGILLFFKKVIKPFTSLYILHRNFTRIKRTHNVFSFSSIQTWKLYQTLNCDVWDISNTYKNSLIGGEKTAVVYLSI
jgi:hypothetical protein